MTPEILYTCPHCQRTGFTHRGLTNHICTHAPGGTKRALTKPEIAKIVVNSSLPKPNPKP